MRTLLSFLFLSTLAIGCSKKDNMAAPVGPDNSMPASCPAGGEPQAEGVACGAIFEGCCFADPAAACAAAGCADSCQQAESMPVQVSCAPAAAPMPEEPAADAEATEPGAEAPQ